MKRLILVALALLLLAQMGLMNDLFAVAETPTDSSFSSPIAKAAKSRRDASVKRAQDEYRKMVDAADRICSKSLSQAVLSPAVKKDPAEAQRIQEAITACDHEQQQASDPSCTLVFQSPTAANGRITEGMSSADAVKILGEPTSKKTEDDGVETWIWDIHADNSPSIFDDKATTPAPAAPKQDQRVTIHLRDNAVVAFSRELIAGHRGNPAPH